MICRYGALPIIYEVEIEGFGRFHLIHYGWRWFVYGRSSRYDETDRDYWFSCSESGLQSFLMQAFQHNHPVVSRLEFLIRTGKSFESSIENLDEELRKEDERERGVDNEHKATGASV